MCVCVCFTRQKELLLTKDQRAVAGRQSNKPQVTVWQSKKRTKTGAKLVAALCKNEMECFRRPWLLEESFAAAAAVAFALALTLCGCCRERESEREREGRSMGR